MEQESTNNHKLIPSSALKRLLDFWPAVIRRFVKKSGFVHASSLSYTTLVGMIPVLAVGLSVATSLMFKDGDEGRAEVEVWIDSMVKTVAPMLDLEIRNQGGMASSEIGFEPSAGPDLKQEEGFETSNIWEQSSDPTTLSELISMAKRGDGGRRREVARQIAEFVSKIHTRTIGMTSVVVFLVVAILLLRAIERTFNQVWEIPKNRGWGAGVAQYWAGLTLGPFLFIIGTGVSSSSTLQDLTVFLSDMRWFGKFLLFVFAWVITGSACALIYRIMTNTRVTWRAAMAGGLSAGLLLQLNSQLSVVYFSNVATANKIYGSLGAIPILLLGLYVSWIILIFGSHVAYLVQFPTQDHVGKSTSENNGTQLSILSAMRLLQAVADRFNKGEEAFNVEELAAKLELDLADLLNLVNVLIEGGLLFQGAGSEAKVTLAKPADSIALVQVYRLLESDELKFEESVKNDPCVLAYSHIMDTRNKSAADMTIQDLMHSKPTS
jgi:membrane protein